MSDEMEQVALHEAAQERYLNYALSVITSRALPDVRDGLKPVQRRILYAMYHNLRLTQDSKPRKSAAVVGEVMAKYHPHGDQAIYDAMVRMAQPFALRYMLVEGQGNFGSLDGDSAAAMRYTEARLQGVAEELLSELGRRTVAMRPNYDGQHSEPEVLPAQLPNLLLNGAVGIAVGMATSIPPHNLRELLKACVVLIEQPGASLAELLKHIKGPDFPTGGRLLNSPEELAELYESGSGSLKIVGEHTIEEGSRGEKRLVVTSIPYMVNKATLIEKIAEHIRDGSVPQLVDVRDESTEVVRIVLELAPKADPRLAMAYLTKNTPLQSRFNVNLTCLIPNADGPPTPARVSLRDALRHFLDFRFEVVGKRLRFDLEQLERRIHLLEAFEAIFSALDEVLRIVREADDKPEAARGLIARFGLDEEQAEAVLETKLYRISKIQITQIQQELAEKRAEAAKLRTLLGDDVARWALIKKELNDLRTKYGDKRLTSVEGPMEEIEVNAEDFVVKEDTVVIVTRDGWVKRQRSYNDLANIRVREGDELGWVIHTQTHQAVIFFTSRGQAYTTLADSIPATAGYGAPIQASFEFADGERIVGVYTSDPAVAPREVPGWFLNENAERVEPGSLPIHLIAVTRAGYGVRFLVEPYAAASNRNGRGFIKLREDAECGEPDAVVAVVPSNGTEGLCLATRKCRAMSCRVAELPEVKGRAAGLAVVKLEKGDAVFTFRLVTRREDALELETSQGRKEALTLKRFRMIKRGSPASPVRFRDTFTSLTRAPVVYREPAPSNAAPPPTPPTPEPAAKPKPLPELAPKKERFNLVDTLGPQDPSAEQGERVPKRAKAPKAPKEAPPAVELAVVVEATVAVVEAPAVPAEPAVAAEPAAAQGGAAPTDSARKIDRLGAIFRASAFAPPTSATSEAALTEEDEDQMTLW